MTSHRSQEVWNEGVRIHYLDSGGPELGAPIVFVPGMSDVAADYHGVLDTLGRRTAVVELRGHGRSAAPADGYTLAHQASDIDAVVNAVTDGPIHLMTFSRGTCYALAWAFDHADRVRSVSIGDYPAREIALPTDAIDSFLSATWRGTPVSDRLDTAAAAAIFASAEERDFFPDLAALDVPVLAVRSSADFPISDDDWARYRSDVPGAELVLFDDSPHDIFRPDRLRYPSLVAAHTTRSD